MVNSQMQHQQDFNQLTIQKWDIVKLDERIVLLLSVDGAMCVNMWRQFVDAYT